MATPVTFDVDYAPAAPGVGAIDTKRDRELHPLYENAGSTKIDGWLRAVPRNGTEVGGVHGILPGTMSKICMAFVRCSDDLRGQKLSDYGCIKASVWDRFLNTIAAIHGGDGSKPITLGDLFGDMDAKFSQATQAQRDALTLNRADVERSIAVTARPAAPAATASPAEMQTHAEALSAWEGGDTHPYAWLRALTFGDLCGDTGDLFALGRLMHAIPAWTSDRVRASTAFKRALVTLAKAAIEGTDLSLTSDADEVAACIASKLKIIDLPRPMESFGGSSQDAHTRALAKEMKSVDEPKTRRELLRERFIDIVSRIAGVRALVGVRGDGSCDMNGTTGFGLCAEVSARMGIVRSEEDFGWAPLGALRDEIGHLDEMFRAQPWVGRTPRDRADHVIDLHRKHARRVAAAPSSYLTPEKTAGAATESALSAAEARARGAVPKHFQGDVGQAMSLEAYRALKAALIARYSQGGAAAIDVLQIAASGVALDLSTNKPMPRKWSPLMAMLAEGTTRGVDAATLDPELQFLSDAARDHWAELYGRTAGLQLTADKATLPPSLEGWGLPELAKSFASSDWSAIDLGAAYEAARARMRGVSFKAGPADKAYTTKQSIENALEVAEALLMLRGFGGNGKGTLPFILEEVRNTFMIYGGQGASARTLKFIATEGRAYIVATLAHFGRARHSAIANKNPLAPDHERKTTSAATQRWTLHVGKLQAALDFAGYVDYMGDGGHADDSDDGAGGGGDRANGGSSGGAGKSKKKRPADEAAKEDTPRKDSTLGVSMSLNLKKGTLTITPKNGKPRIYLTERLRELAKLKKRCCIKGMAAAALHLPEREFCDFDHEDGCAEHQWKSAGANLSLCREDGAERPVKRQKTHHTNSTGTKKGAGDDGDDDDDDDDVGDGGGGGGTDGGGGGDDAGADDAGAGAGQPPPTTGAGSSGRSGDSGRGKGGGKGSGRGSKGSGRGGGRGTRKTIGFTAAASATKVTATGASLESDIVRNTTCDIAANHGSLRGVVRDDRRLSAPVIRFYSLNGVEPATAGAAASPYAPTRDRTAAANQTVITGFSEKEGAVRIQDPVFVQALTRLETPVATVTIGDASGVIRDASNDAGWPAIAAAEQPCESMEVGFSFEGNVNDVLRLCRWQRAIAFPDARQQAARMGLGMAAVKVADGRLFAGMARWLYLWCVTAAAVCIVQPDVFIVDFYDAPFVATTPKAWGDDGEDLALLFWRGAPHPVPQHSDRVAAPISDERRRPRDDALATSRGLMRGVATQLEPDGSDTNPKFGVEIERLAAAFYAAGLPIPPWYGHADAGPPEPTDRIYMFELGRGDGRRLDDHVVPRLVRRDLGDHAWCDGVDEDIATSLRHASVPAVSPRGRSLADGYRALRRADAERAIRAQARQGRAHNIAITRVRADVPGANAVAVIPGRIDGGVVMLLLPSPSQSTAEVAGRTLPEAHGATSEARKLITSAADALGNALVKANAHGGGTQTAWARSALAMILALGGVSLAVVVLLAPPDVQPSSEAIAEGFSWQRAAAAAGLPRHTVVCVAEQFIRRWVSAIADVHIAGGRTGVAEAQPTARALNAERLASVDLAAAAREEASALMHVSAGLQDAAAREPRLADALLCWREKVATAHDFSPPALVAALGREPPAVLAAKPFTYRCTIPRTPPVEMRGMAPRWPAGVPRPASMLETYSPQARDEVRAQLDAVEQWNAARVSGVRAPRPNHKSWSDGARLPWFRGRVLWERDGCCEIIDTRLPAARVRMHREAVLWMLRDFPHRQLVSFLVHGVTLHDDLPLQTSIAANLLSFYEVRGGPDAVAEEMHGLKERGWYLSSAGLAATAETPTTATVAAGTAGTSVVAATASPTQAARLLTSPARINPRGAVPRKDLGPPRGVAELGYPRRETFTADTGEIVTSINVATSTEHSATTDDKFWARQEVKPRPGDLMCNLLVLRAMGNLLWAAAGGTAPATLLILFDYKYFFHALAYMAGEVWKTGCAVPAREASGTASRTRLDVLLELVLAMGWTQASKIAQDFANALMWLLLRSVDEALAPHIAELRKLSADFDAMWRGRLALQHDDYGTQARIVTALQYTDDSVKACLGATATVTTIVVFCRMIGPRFYPGPDAHEAARGTVTRSILDEYGVALQAWRQLTPKGSVRAIGRDECEPSNARTVPTGRGTAGGNPFPVTAGQNAQRATAGYACLLASVPGTTARDVGALLGLQTAPGYEQLLSEQLQALVNDLAERVLAGDHLALKCPGCRSPLQQGCCHSLLLATAVAQRCSIALETEAGPPTDPVTAPPRAACGLDLEAAKMHKWHLGGSGIWTGVGMSATALVTWVPQSKAARCLVEILEVLDGRCEVSRYRSLHGALADLVLPTGGGWYRMQGMAVPLQSDQELGEGPNVIVRERPQLWKRLKAWQTILANSPGAAMVAALPAAHSAKRTDVITWDIGGDAAKDGEPKQGLGAWFYGVWWCAPLGEWPVLAAAHITCLELVEVGLGVVMTTRWLGEAKRVRLRADAMAAFLTVRARRDDSTFSRGAKASELVAVHEVMMRQPEWVQLHDGHREVLVEQTFGESMLLHDAASRNNVELIRDVAAALGIVPKRLELSHRALSYLHEVSLALSEARQSVETHTPMHAAALALGSAANGAGPRTPFAQAWPGASTSWSLTRYLQKEDDADQGASTSASARARHARDEQRRIEAAMGIPTLGAPPPALWTPSLPPDFSDVIASRCAKRHASPMATPHHDDTDERAVAFTAALARCAAGRVRFEGEGADQAAPSRAIVTARAVAPPVRAVEIARAALKSATAPPPTVATTNRNAAELEESQRMLIERSIQDARCDEDGLGIRGASDELLRGLLTAAMLAVEKRFAPSTRGQDRSYWRMWAAWCDQIGTPPLRTNAAANEGRIEHLHRREIALALGAFMTWAVEAEQRGYKIESMLNRLRGVARRHWAVTIRFVSLALVVQAAQGLIREHIDAHGADALRRRSKEPFDTAEIVAILRLPPGTVVPYAASGITVGDNLEWQGIVVFITLYCTGGWRKEAIALGAKEVFGGRKLSLGEVTYRIGGILYRVPTIAVLLALTWGDMGYVNPVPCKNDPDNSKFGGSPVPSRYHATQPICLVRELAKYEIMRMRADPTGSATMRRKDAPLVLSPAGRSWSKGELSKFFDGLLRLVCSEERARQLSIHSFRVWLACALLAAGATPEQIMLMVRWSSEAARKLYARLAMTTQCSLHAGAIDASFDSIRAHTLLDASAATDVSTDIQAAAEALQRATGLLDTVTDESKSRVASTAELRRTCSIDDDNVFSMLEEASGALEGLAVSADAAFTEASAPAPESSSDDEP